MRREGTFCPGVGGKVPFCVTDEHSAYLSDFSSCVPSYRRSFAVRYGLNHRVSYSESVILLGLRDRRLTDAAAHIEAKSTRFLL